MHNKQAFTQFSPGTAKLYPALALCCWNST